jgi:hypothetical protein
VTGVTPRRRAHPARATHNDAVRRTVAVATLLVVGLAAGRAAAARGEPEPAEPALCREALAAHPEKTPVQALRAEEAARWQRARRAAREGRRSLNRAIGAGDAAGARVIAGEFHGATEAHREALREGRILCGCRARRGDPDDADCERLYPLPPDARTPSASDAAPRDSGS